MLKRSLNILLVVIIGAVVGLAPAQSAKALEPTLYNQPGVHYVQGRYWKTECAMYSEAQKIVRCKTDIWGTKIVSHDGKYYDHEGWVFNNLTYLPAPQSAWAGNPLAIDGAAWTDEDGRAWLTDCTASECRTYVTSNRIVKVGGVYQNAPVKALNSILQFSSEALPHQTTILEPAPVLANAPVEKPFVPPLKPTVYTQPGDHLVNGRYWNTDCEMYSSEVVRCSTDIWATKVVLHAGKYYKHNGWAFNNMTYLPAPKAQWGNNPLANSGEWTGTDGRKWRTECDTATTGANGCRTYAMARIVDTSTGGFVPRETYVLNNMVSFSTSTVAHQKTIPAAAPALSGVPVEQPFVPPAAVTFRADSRCMTGRALCISKNQRKMAWMVNGQILKVVDVRFGKEGASTQTRNGTWKVEWKSRNHVSSIYNTPMPFAMFFSGGQAVHYSDNFRRVGYNNNSAGCVNVRDYDAIKWMFDTQVKTGDKVIVYY